MSTSLDPSQAARRNEVWAELSTSDDPAPCVTVEMARFPCVRNANLQSLAQVHFLDNGVAVIGLAEFNSRTGQYGDLESTFTLATGGLIGDSLQRRQKAKEAKNELASSTNRYRETCQEVSLASLRERFVRAPGESHLLAPHEIRSIHVAEKPEEVTSIDTVYGRIELPKDLPALYAQHLREWGSRISSSRSVQSETRTVWTPQKMCLFCRLHKDDRTDDYLASSEARGLLSFVTKSVASPSDLSNFCTLLVKSLVTRRFWGLCDRLTALATPQAATFVAGAAARKRRAALQGLLIWIVILVAATAIAVAIPMILISLGEQNRAAGTSAGSNEMRGPIGLIVTIVWMASGIAVLASPFGIVSSVRAIVRSRKYRSNQVPYPPSFLSAGILSDNEGTDNG